MVISGNRIDFRRQWNVEMASEQKSDAIALHLVLVQTV